MTRTLKRREDKKISIRYFEGINYKILVSVFVAGIFFSLSQISSSLFSYLGAAVIIAALIFIKREDYLYLSLALVNVLPTSTVFGISSLNIITVVYFVQTYLLDNEYKREKDKHRLPKSVTASGVVFIMYGLNYLITLSGSDGLQKVLVAIKTVLMLIYLVDSFRDFKDKESLVSGFRKMQVYFVLGTLITSLMSIAVNPDSLFEEARLTLTDGGVGGATRLGILLAFCLVFVTMAMTKVRNLVEWLVLVGAALPLLYLCFSTQSRTCIIAMIVILAAVSVFGMIRKESRIWILLMLLGVVVVLGGLILFTEGSQIYESIMHTIYRFQNPSGGDITNGRADLWVIYIEKLKSDMRLFFLGGARNEYASVESHNMFIEIIALNGFFGSIIVVWMYTAVYCSIRKSVLRFAEKKVHPLGFLPLATLFLVGMASFTILRSEFTIYYCLGVAMVYMYSVSEFDEKDSDSDANKAENSLKTRSARYRLRNQRPVRAKMRTRRVR